ncbi:acyltransferase family protein [Aeromicrobium sp. Leaf350]|uniref:acyltransferase family protein n=1 Tax=Aeromicrobium sp. Leaf350 TaxID=2876565 RepID=UPI001E2C9395|nr:acyltransferase family protein [Aeromicrobium sp. Leaf350]
MNPAVTAAAEESTPRGSGNRSAARAERRTDIDGLRALAILLVVVYHVWFGRVSGGVDVFLMISAYLLTASLVATAARGERLRLGRHWLSRFSRLMPPAVVTIGGVLAMTYLLYPETSWSQMWREAWASVLYVQNWQLAAAEVDYYARELGTTSALQHFWSLSVQGQVFVIWPILIAVTAWCVRRRPRWLLPALVALFTVVFVVSLTFSVISTAESQDYAYFDTRTRLWEFAAGSLVALLLPYLRLPSPVRAVLGWVGVVAIVLCGVVIDVRGGFPGYLALWPVLATAFVLVAGGEPTRGGPAALLGSRPLMALSRHAYALYLVHWPILIAWTMLRGRDTVGPLGGAAIILVSLAAARLLTRDVEHPVRSFALRHRPEWRQAVVIAASVVVVAGPLVAWQAQQQARAAAIVVDPTDRERYPGAWAVDDPDWTPWDVPIVPLATELDDEWVFRGEPCTGDWVPSDPILSDGCFQDSPEVANDRTVLVLGDSHAQQLAEPLTSLALEEGWHVVFMLRGGCPLGFGEVSISQDEEICEQWRRAALDYALEKRPGAAYLITTKVTPQEPERLLTGVDIAVAELLDAGIDVISVRDNPRFSFNMYECAVDVARDCVVPREHVLAATDPGLELDARVLQVDFSPWFCPGGRCDGAVGNIAVYLDDNHVTRSFGATLTPVLAQQIREQRELLMTLR